MRSRTDDDWPNFTPGDEILLQVPVTAATLAHLERWTCPRAPRPELVLAGMARRSASDEEAQNRREKESGKYLHVRCDPEPVVVVWDVDEVLKDCSGSMCRHLNPVFGSNTSPDEWTDLDFWKRFTSSKEDFDRAMIEHQVYEHCDPIKGARYVVERIAGHNVWRQMIVTGRGLHPRAADMTAESFTRDGIGQYFERIVVVDNGASKLPALRSIARNQGPIAAYIEDNPVHAQAAIDHKLASAVFLIDKPWNRDSDCGAIRLSSIHEIEQALRAWFPRRFTPTLPMGSDIGGFGDLSQQVGPPDPEKI